MSITYYNPLIDTLFDEQSDLDHMTVRETVYMLWDMGLIDIGQIMEQATSKESGVQLCERNTPGIDLVSGKQLKIATTHKVKDRPNQRKSNIGIKNTTADIMAVVMETLTKKFYYFYIPYEAYSHLTGNTISVSFDGLGRPSFCQWWPYEVTSFKELSKLA